VHCVGLFENGHELRTQAGRRDVLVAVVFALTSNIVQHRSLVRSKNDFHIVLPVWDAMQKSTQFCVNQLDSIPLRELGTARLVTGHSRRDDLHVVHQLIT
jgi:hypothetical protein